MTTQSYLGKLKKLTLWIDNKGSSPNWMVSKILIVDLKTDEKYAFIRQENNILKIYPLFFNFHNTARQNGICTKENLMHVRLGDIQ